MKSGVQSRVLNRTNQLDRVRPNSTHALHSFGDHRLRIVHTKSACKINSLKQHAVKRRLRELRDGTTFSTMCAATKISSRIPCHSHAVPPHGALAPRGAEARDLPGPRLARGRIDARSMSTPARADPIAMPPNSHNMCVQLCVSASMCADPQISTSTDARYNHRASPHAQRTEAEHALEDTPRAQRHNRHRGRKAVGEGPRHL